MSKVQLRAVRKVYPDGFEAVDDLDIEIDDGELFVLVGPSGCGKSSVLRMIAGLETITGGEVLVDGVRVNDVPTNARNLSMVFQNSTLYPHLTVAENLGFPLRMAGVGKAALAAQVAEVADLLGLAACLDSRSFELSGGERQRVALGRAIVRRSELLLMDEPMSNLDAKLRTELRSELSVLLRRLGVTTVYVTHDQVEAMALGDRIAVMRHGRIVQSGRPVDVYRHPVDTFVAQFIGTPPMNLLVSRVVDDEAGVGLCFGSHRLSIGDIWDIWPDLGDLVGREIIVGIRPEAFRRDPHGELVLSLRYHEQVGATQWVHAVIDAEMVDTRDAGDTVGADEPTVVAALEGRREISLWKPLRLAVDHTQIYLFDSATGVALRSASAAVPPDDDHPNGATVIGTPFNAMLPLTGS